MGVSTNMSVSSADTCHVHTVSMLQCRNVAYKKNFVRRRTVTYIYSAYTTYVKERRGR